MKACPPIASFSARLLGLTVAAVTLLVVGGAAHGQVTDGVRVIDIKYLLDNHPRFQSAMDALKKDFDATAARIQEQRQAILRLEEQLKTYSTGSAEYKRLDEEVSRKKADWALQADRQRKEFRNRESEILWNVYYEIQSAVKAYCERNNVGLVIQFNGEPVDPKQAQKVVQYIGRPLVYVAPNRDITPIIRDMMKRDDGPRVGGPAAPIGVPPRR